MIDLLHDDIVSYYYSYFDDVFYFVLPLLCAVCCLLVFIGNIIVLENIAVDDRIVTLLLPFIVSIVISF